MKTLPTIAWQALPAFIPDNTLALCGVNHVSLQLAIQLKLRYRREVLLCSIYAHWHSPSTIAGIPCVPPAALPEACTAIITSDDEAEREFFADFTPRQGLSTSLFDHSSYDEYVNDCPDELFLRASYYLSLRYDPDFHHPRTFNEKLNFLKLYASTPLLSELTDKAAVKEHIASAIGQEYLLPTLGVWDSVQDFVKDYDSLPDSFIVKCTHDSGSAQICRSKVTFDLAAAADSLSVAFGRNYYCFARESCYKNIVPRLIAEPLLPQEHPEEPPLDYKYHVFNGKAWLLEIISDRHAASGTHGTFIDPQTLTRYPVAFTYPPAPTLTIAPVKGIHHMRDLAEQLAVHFNLPYVRADFYCEKEQIFFGELTFYSSGGYRPFNPPCWDFTLGDLLDTTELELALGEHAETAPRILAAQTTENASPPPQLVDLHNNYNELTQILTSLFARDTRRSGRLRPHRATLPRLVFAHRSKFFAPFACTPPVIKAARDRSVGSKYQHAARQIGGLMLLPIPLITCHSSHAPQAQTKFSRSLRSPRHV